MKIVLIVKGSGADFGNVFLAENIICLITNAHPSASISIIADQPEELRRKISFPVFNSLFPISAQDKRVKRSFRMLKYLLMLSLEFIREKTGIKIGGYSDDRGTKRMIVNADLIYLLAQDGIGPFQCSAHEFLFELSYLSLLKKHVVIVTSVINPFRNYFSNSILRNSLENCSLIYSENHTGIDLSKSGSTKLNSLSELNLLQDCQSDYDESEHSGPGLIITVTDNGTVGVRRRNDYYNLTGCCADRLIKEKDARIIFLGSFRSEAAGISAMEKILSCINEKHKVYFSFNPSFQDVKDLLKRADLCITTDHNICVLSAKSATPVILISSDHYLQSFMYDIRMGIYVLEPENLSSELYFDLILSALNSHERSRNLLIHTIPDNVRRVKRLLNYVTRFYDEFAGIDETENVKYIINIM
jgi:polysaccharide pyruvyl transferase WcaK-like protein